MNKLFKPKTMRRILLFMALIFPVVYLCGGLFFALNGAHGENVLATEEQSVVDRKAVDFNQLVDGYTHSGYGNLTMQFDSATGEYTVLGVPNTAAFIALSYSNISIVSQHTYIVRTLPRNEGNYFTYFNSPYLVFNNEWTRITAQNDNNNLYFALRVENSFDFGDGLSFIPQIFDLTQMFGYGNEPTLDVFLSYFGDGYYPRVLSEYRTIPVYGVPNEQNSLFFHLFGQRNFVSDIGRDVLSGTADGFAPMNDLFRVVNDNVLHFDEGDSLAVFGFGYLYYAVNVIVIYEVVTIALKLLLLPLKVVDKLEVEKDA